MNGGGDSEAYCPACGFPFGEGSDEEEKRIHTYYWMQNVMGYETTGKHRIFELFQYDYGQTFEGIEFMHNNNANNDFNDSESFRLVGAWYSPDEVGPYFGIAIHIDCVKAIEQKLERKLTYKDAILINANYNRKGFPDLQGCDAQWFNWLKAVRTLPAWMFESPLNNNKSLARILKKLPNEIKETSLARAKMVHTMVEHIEEIPMNLAPIITEYATGRKAYEYMPERFKKPNNAKGGKRKTRRMKRSKRKTR